MSKAIIINNPIELCENWGWYVDIESSNQYFHNNNYKYRIRKFQQINIEIFEHKVNNDEEYDYYMNQGKKIKIKNSLETIIEVEEEKNTDCKNTKLICTSNILRLSSVTIITGILIFIILLTI